MVAHVIHSLGLSSVWNPRKLQTGLFWTWPQHKLSFASLEKLNSPPQTKFSASRHGMQEIWQEIRTSLQNHPGLLNYFQISYLILKIKSKSLYSHKKTVYNYTTLKSKLCFTCEHKLFLHHLLWSVVSRMQLLCKWKTHCTLFSSCLKCYWSFLIIIMRMDVWVADTSRM